jgi:hypothetical protein
METETTASTSITAGATPKTPRQHDLVGGVHILIDGSQSPLAATVSSAAQEAIGHLGKGRVATMDVETDGGVKKYYWERLGQGKGIRELREYDDATVARRRLTPERFCEQVVDYLHNQNGVFRVQDASLVRLPQQSEDSADWIGN